MSSKTADRHNEGKLRYTLTCPHAIEEMVKTLEYGATKYPPDNWKKGFPYLQIMDSLYRHLEAIRKGHDKDPESGLLHAAHAMSNAMFLTHMMLFRPEMDDRGKEARAILKDSERRSP